MEFDTRLGPDGEQGSLTAGLIDEIIAEFPRFRLLKKRGRWEQRAIDLALKVLTFGGQSGYISDYHTTIGRTVYLADRWNEMSDSERYILMRHELVHLRQFKRYTLPGMMLLYLLVFFPVGLAWFRAHFEKEGYFETLRATAECMGIEAIRDPELKAYVIRQFTGPAYAWMWPFRDSIERWYDRSVTAIAAGERRL